MSERERQRLLRSRKEVVSLRRGFPRLIFDTRRLDAAVGEERNCRRICG